MTRCRSCGAEIHWVRTVTGATMPIDALPAKDGNVLVDTETGEATVLGRPEDYAHLVRYKSHFATCPQAKTWRRKGG